MDAAHKSLTIDVTSSNAHIHILLTPHEGSSGVNQIISTNITTEYFLNYKNLAQVNITSSNVSIYVKRVNLKQIDKKLLSDEVLQEALDIELIPRRIIMNLNIKSSSVNIFMEPLLKDVIVYQQVSSHVNVKYLDEVKHDEGHKKLILDIISSNANIYIHPHKKHGDSGFEEICSTNVTKSYTLDHKSSAEIKVTSSNVNIYIMKEKHKNKEEKDAGEEVAIEVLEELLKSKKVVLELKAKSASVNIYVEPAFRELIKYQQESSHVNVQYLE